MFKTPIPAKGKLNLYSLDGEVAAKARAGIAAAQPLTLDSVAQAWVEAMKSYENKPSLRRNALFETYLEMAGGGINALRLAKLEMAETGDLEAVLDVARAKQACGDYEMALSEMNDVIKKDPDFARAYAVRSLLYEQLSLNDRAKAIELNPEYDAILNEGSNSDEEVES